MLGKDLFKVDANVELSNERLRSLIFFYAPMLGNDAVVLYQYLVLQGSIYAYQEINELLSRLNISIDNFEDSCDKLNKYRLLKTLKQDNRYVLVLNAPLTIKKFVNDDIFVREFILKTSGEYYRYLTADIIADNYYNDFEDISSTLSIDNLSMWSKEDETYLKPLNDSKYEFNTIFNINHFLKDISVLMFPLKYRSSDNLKQIATLADLYGISYDKMRSYVADAVNQSDDQFNLKKLRYSCMKSKNEYQKIEENKYDVPCLNYLMSLQDGKEVTDYDKKILYNLAFKYHLNNEVINVLLSHSLKNCNNRLLENYIYPIASDLHRNDIKNALDALNRLSKDYQSRKSEDIIPSYDTSKNKKLSKQELDDLLSLRGK